MTWAIVPAAGRGTRFGGELPKQYLPVEGAPLIAHTLAALFAHDAVEGAVVPVSENDALIRALRKNKAAATPPQAAYAGYQPPSAPQQFEQSNGAPQATGFADSDVPFRLPPGFDMNSFLSGARDHYRTLQEAWNKNDLEKVREYVSPELFQHLQRVGDAAAPEGIPDPVDLVAQFTGEHRGRRGARGRSGFAGRLPVA